ncbi:MAG TPA: hypothetical protein VFQ96_01695, partial [Microbacteriaceae bacterium]|nr:hypothetical protein [Microbacteriaceae bacterium]
RRTRSNPLYSVIAIGLSLVAGATVTLLLGAGGWTPRAALAGVAVTLGVCGLAVVVNGFLGRRSGGAGGVAILAVIALVLGSPFAWVAGPVVTGRSVSWSPSYSPATVERTVVGGSARLDLTHYFDGGSSETAGSGSQAGTVILRVVGGPAEVIVPADASSRVTARALGGSVTLDGRTSDRPFASERASFGPVTPGAAGRRVVVEVWVLGGEITATQARLPEGVTGSQTRQTKEPTT